MANCYLCGQPIRFKGLTTRHKLGQGLTYITTNPTCYRCLLQLKNGGTENVENELSRKVMEKAKAMGKNPDQIIKKTLKNEEKKQKIIAKAESYGVSKEVTKNTMDKISENVKDVKE